MPPKSYALYQQCLFAKQLLHQTKLPITQVALASGFDSVRRFNDCFKAQLKLTPSMMRKSGGNQANTLALKIYFRPPYDWSFVQGILAGRAVAGLEWCDEQSYGRTFRWQSSTGRFTALHNADNNMFELKIELDEVKYLKSIVNNIRRILDLDVDIGAVEKDLQLCLPDDFSFRSGVRMPGIWSMFEAGVRAILGQQISVVAAKNLVSDLVTELGDSNDKFHFFPSPKSVAASDLDFLKIPNSRKQTLRNLAQHYITHENPDDPENWLKLKGIGPWTVDYAQLRGLSNPDVFLGGDLGIKKALEKNNLEFNPEHASPWRSYLTFQLWSQL